MEDLLGANREAPSRPQRSLAGMWIAVSATTSQAFPAARLAFHVT